MIVLWECEVRSDAAVLAIAGPIDGDDIAVSNRRWYDGNIVLAGDAAHTTHFTIGSGTTLAIEDAIALAGNLQRHHGERKLALETELAGTMRVSLIGTRPPGPQA